MELKGGENGIKFHDRSKVAFPNLERLVLNYVDGLEEIWHHELHSDSFCMLKKLEVEQGKKLLNIFLSKMLRRFKNLEYLNVTDCASLEEVFDLQSLINQNEAHDVTATQLRKMYLRKAPGLKHVWNGNPQGILSFQNLHMVRAWTCPGLKILFPSSIAMHLLQLEKLVINEYGIEEIISREEGAEAVPRFEFPRVIYLKLFDLPELKRFYPEMHTSEWPVLKELRVCHCEKMTVFDSEIQNLQGPFKEDEIEIQVPQPLLHHKHLLLKYTFNGFLHVDRSKWGQVAAVCWAIWKHRNEVVWEQKFSPARVVVTSAIQLLQAWVRIKSQENLSQTSYAGVPGTERWEKPDYGWVKMSVDAAVFENDGACSAVMRDHCGRFVGGFTNKFVSLSDPVLLEVLAIREALNWMKDRRRSHFVIESDCLLAVQWVNTSRLGQSGLDEIIKDCHILLSTLPLVRVVFVKKTANAAAHHLARAARCSSGLYVWGLNLPDCIHSALVTDLME